MGLSWRVTSFARIEFWLLLEEGMLWLSIFAVADGVESASSNFMAVRTDDGDAAEFGRIASVVSEFRMSSLDWRARIG